MGTDHIDSAHWADMLMEGAAHLNLEITSRQAELFIRHARLLLVWNRKVNLTAITDPVQIAVKHYLDSVAPLNHLPVKGELLDIGTGGGFPGIPLKIMRPRQSMTLIDGTRKKINFVKQTIRELGLDHIEALHQRAETMGSRDKYAGRYATIISRAVANLRDAAQLAAPLLSAGGKIVIYKGPTEQVPDKLVFQNKRRKQVETIAFQVRVIDYQLPIIREMRRAIILESPAP